MTLANYHTHTRMCDGNNTPEEMVGEALRQGLKALGFSGHMDQDIHMDFPAYVREVRRLREKYREKLDILVGVELDALYRPETLEGAEYRIGSTHFLDVETELDTGVDVSAENLRALTDQCFGGDPYRMVRAYYALESQVVERTDCSFVGHFDLITRFNDDMRLFDEEDRRYMDPALEAMEALCRKDVPFEINCGAFNRGRKRELYPRQSLLRALHDFGGRILISSDAHDAVHLTGGFDTARERARDAGFREVWYLRHEGNGVQWYEEAL